MGDPSNNNGAEITLYFNMLSNYSHRVQIALTEMGLNFKEVDIELGGSKTADFLKLNPRGLVPVLTFQHPSLSKPQTLIESDLILHFLFDAYPHLSQTIWPAPVNIETASMRYRMEIFAENFLSQVEKPYWYPMVFASGTDAIDGEVDKMVAAVREHIEPLLEDAKPFFGGSTNITLAEILTIPLVFRMYELADDELLPKSLIDKLEDLPNFSKWVHATISRDSVVSKWNTKVALKMAHALLSSARAKPGTAT